MSTPSVNPEQPIQANEKRAESEVSALSSKLSETSGTIKKRGTTVSGLKGETMEDDEQIDVFERGEFIIESNEDLYVEYTDPEEEKSLQALFPELYAPWFLRLVMGLQDDDMRRYLYADRDQICNTEGVVVEPRKIGKTEADRVHERERKFGRVELNNLLEKSIFANVKSAGRIQESMDIPFEDRVPWVAVDVIRWLKEDGSRHLWGDFEEMGIFIEEANKTTKRNAIATREAFLAMRVPKSSISIEVIGRRDLHHFTDSFPMLGTMNAILDGEEEGDVERAQTYIDEAVKCIDSASAIGKSLYNLIVAHCIERAELDPTQLRTQQLFERLDNSAGGEIKVVDENGVWKGDYMISPNSTMTSIDGQNRPIDLRMFSGNCKSEFRWESEDIFILLEVHPRHKAKQIVFTDDQTHSWLLRRILNKDLLTKVGKDYNNQVLNGLAKGEIPEFLARYNPKDEGENHGQISNLQAVITKFTGRMGQDSMRVDKHCKDCRLPKMGGTIIQYPAFDIRCSAWIINTLGNGHLLMLNSGKRAYRFPIPGCGQYFVATQAWLKMAEWSGLPEIPQGSCGYVDSVDRLVYHDLDFVGNYLNHGGHDLDDKHNVIWCRYRNGAEFYIVYRTPNSYGEYAIMDIAPGTKIQKWTDVTGEQWGPTLVTKKHLPMTIHQLKSAIPEAPQPVKLSGKWTPEAFTRRLEKTIQGARGVGEWVNRQIVYYWTVDASRPLALVGPETVIDTYVQDMDEIRIGLCSQDQTLTMEQLKTAVKNGFYIDKELWFQRVQRNTPEAYRPFSNGTSERAVIAAVYDILKNDFADGVTKLANESKKHVLPLTQFIWSDETLNKANKVRADYANKMDEGGNQGRMGEHKFWVETAELIGKKINLMDAKYPDHAEKIMMMLNCALVIYRSGGDKVKDNMLYMRSKNFETNGQLSLIDHWIEALTFTSWYNFCMNWDARVGQ